MPTTLFYGDRSGSMAGKNIELASTAFMEVVVKVGLAGTDIQLGLVNTSLEKQPAAKRSREELMAFVQRWQRSINGGTRVWQSVWDDVSTLGIRDANVIVITDGLDNSSEGRFAGPQGAHTLFAQLNAQGVEHVSFNIVGIGQLPPEVSSVFENISSISGGLYHNIRSTSDLPAFSLSFVQVMTEAIQNPTMAAARRRDRQVDAKLSVGIFDDQVKGALRENEKLKKENEQLKDAQECLKLENQKLREDQESLKQENQKMRKEVDELKETMKEHESFKSDSQSIKEKNSKLEGEVGGLKSELDQLKKMLNPDYMKELLSNASRPSTASTEASGELQLA